MSVETAVQISQLNNAWPLGTDPRSEGDNHIRLLKAVLLDVFNDGTSGIMQLVLQHVKAGLLAATKQGIEFDDSGDGTRLRLSTDPTNALANGLLELYDNAHVLQRSMKATTAGADGNILTDGNSFYIGTAAGQVVFPVGSILMAYIPGLVIFARNAVVAVTLDIASTSGYTINGTGTALTGTWQVRGGAGVRAGGGASDEVVYLIQRTA
jgi:hypothetical protein